MDICILIYRTAPLQNFWIKSRLRPKAKVCIWAQLDKYELIISFCTVFLGHVVICTALGILKLSTGRREVSFGIYHPNMELETEVSSVGSNVLSEVMLRHISHQWTLMCIKVGR